MEKKFNQRPEAMVGMAEVAQAVAQAMVEAQTNQESKGERDVVYKNS